MTVTTLRHQPLPTQRHRTRRNKRQTAGLPTGVSGRRRVAPDAVEKPDDDLEVVDAKWVGRLPSCNRRPFTFATVVITASCARALVPAAHPRRTRCRKRRLGIGRRLRKRPGMRCSVATPRRRGQLPPATVVLSTRRQPRRLSVDEGERGRGERTVDRDVPVGSPDAELVGQLDARLVGGPAGPRRWTCRWDARRRPSCRGPPAVSRTLPSVSSIVAEIGPGS